MTPRPLLQLLPLDLPVDAAHLASDALAAAGPGARSLILRRPAYQTIELARTGYAGAARLHAVGPAVVGAVGSKVPVLYTPTAWDVRRASPVERSSLRALAHRGLLIGVAPSAAHVRQLAQSSLPWARLESVPPTRGLPPRRPGRSDELRKLLGIAPTDRVLVAPGIARRGSGHHLALWATTILAYAEGAQRDWKLALRGEGPGVAALIRFVGAKPVRPLILAEDMLPRITDRQLLQAADLVVALGTQEHGAAPEIRPILEAMAAGIPVRVGAGNAAAEYVPAEYRLPDLALRVLSRSLLDAVESPPPIPAGFRWTDALAAWREIFQSARSGQHAAA